MRNPAHFENTERQVLCALALVCYSATVVALVALGYAFVQLALRDAGRLVSTLYSAQLF